MMLTDLVGAGSVCYIRLSVPDDQGVFPAVDAGYDHFDVLMQGITGDRYTVYGYADSIAGPCPDQHDHQNSEGDRRHGYRQYSISDRPTVG